MKISSFKIGARIWAVTGIPLVLLVVIAAVALISLTQIREKQRWVNFTHGVIAQAEGVVAAAVDMETGMRGFLLAGRDEFLEPYVAGAARMDRANADLLDALSINPAQVTRLREAADIIAEWRAEVAEPMIAVRREVGDGRTMDEVAALVGEARGKAYFDRFRGVMDEVVAEERRLMDMRSAQNDATLRNAFIVIIGGGVLAIAAGVAFGAVIGRGVAKPIGAITGAMRKLAAGDHTVAIPGLGRKDEIGDMADAVGVFKESMIRSEQLAAQEVEERRAREARAKRIESLTSEFDATVSGLLTVVTKAASDMEDTAQDMSSVAEDTSERASVVASASQQASANVQTVATATEELASSIQEIGRQITQSSSIAGRAVQEARQTNEQVQGLANAANRIGDVLNLISEIAEQTNLLALNATIEAARAGEAGRGFAVVASEVKSLATQTASATGEIAQQIETIQAETGQAVDAIRSIGRVIEEIDEISSSIAAAIEQQGAATNEITQNVQQAAVGAQEVNMNITDVTTATGRTKTAVEKVTGLAAALNNEAGGLKDKVDAFLLNVRTA